MADFTITCDRVTGAFTLPNVEAAHGMALCLLFEGYGVSVNGRPVRAFYGPGFDRVDYADTDAPIWPERFSTESY